jgi:ankyrin repeat protein
MVQFLKDRGAGTVNLKDAAWRAAYFGHVEELRAILDQGFDVNESGTLLDTAAEEGHIDVVQLLVGRGARLDTTQGLGTALHAAAYHGQTEIIRYLISKGADPNALESRNYTPLYWAAENGHFEAVRALLDNGADPSLGVSPLAEARRQGHQAVVNLLKERGAKD